MSTRNKKLSDCVYDFVPQFNDSTKVRESSIVDDFYTDVTTSESDGKELTFHVDPIVMLFNQERLNSLGIGAVQQLLSSMEVNGSSLSNLREQCSDDMLLQMIKSRHLQAPSEIQAWLEYVDSNMSEFMAEIERLKSSSENPALEPASVPTE